MIKNMFFLILSFILVFSCAEQNSETSTAKQILDRMVKVYASCKSYQDSGMVRTLFILPDGNRTVEKPFTTAFVRSGRFRFEYKEKRENQDYRYLVWANGKDVRTWWDVTPGIKRLDSLGFALAGVTGVSGGSARRIPALLISEPIGAGWDIRKLRNLKRLEDAKAENADCFRIQGETGIDGQGPVTLWIDKASFLVRRLDQQNKLANFRTEDTTTYEPVVNGEIPDKMLEFDPAK
jgi:outer membrane lipoprotein-sorting protein